ncbi:heparan-alpha-glucosaminide N-acetyltransferase domain-containing protein [Kocuria rhizophila]|nr:heparan-alpha-glucosaminide N-acetyltransferase domain-containing protein [Kocuria rhizophila]
MARGFALVGMIAVHGAARGRGRGGNSSLEWRLFAGHSAALFATLAGVSLAFMTGRNPRRGRTARGHGCPSGARAGAVLIGLSIKPAGAAGLQHPHLLRLMFLVAIPFTPPACGGCWCPRRSSPW